MSNTNHFLSLERPVIFFDLETTGLNQDTDRIVELYAVKQFPDGSQKEVHHYFNPTINIPDEVIAIHGITNEFVADKPTFESLAHELATFFEESDFGGFNLKKFDVPFLMCEFNRFGLYPIDTSTIKIIDSFNLYLLREKRDLTAAVKYYCGEDHYGAHSAKADVLATIKVLKHQLLMYDDLKPNTSFLHDYTKQGNTVDLGGRFVRDDNGEIRFNFGKHSGRLAKEQPDYLSWMLTSDFPFDTKMVAQKIINHHKWNDEIIYWLRNEKILGDTSLLSTLFTCVKYNNELHPFKLTQEEKKLVVCYNKETPALLILTNADHKQQLLSVLEKHLVAQPISVTTT